MPIRKFGLVAEALRGLPGVLIEMPQPVTEVDLLRVHASEYVRAIQTGEPKALAESQKFPWSPELYPSVCLTSGGVVAAARRALSEGISAALVSGFHHAHADHGEGFCTFNGLIVAAEKLKAEGQLKSVGILDLDLHYGNGTASLTETRGGWIRALSIYGNDYFQNQAFRDVKIRQHQDGEFHRSASLPEKSGREVLLKTLESQIGFLTESKPDLLLYQAGADPYFEDPYSPLALDQEDLQARDRSVFAWAKSQGIPIAWVLAGGYTKDVNKVVEVHVNTFRAALTA